jgi:hypothetical protein
MSRRRAKRRPARTQNGAPGSCARTSVRHGRTRRQSRDAMPVLTIRYSIVRAERPFMICSVVLISGARFTFSGAATGASADGVEYAVGGSIR